MIGVEFIENKNILSVVKHADKTEGVIKRLSEDIKCGNIKPGYPTQKELIIIRDALELIVYHGYETQRAVTESIAIHTAPRTPYGYQGDIIEC